VIGDEGRKGLLGEAVLLTLHEPQGEGELTLGCGSVLGVEG
jgi:hypothetical protein